MCAFPSTVYLDPFPRTASVLNVTRVFNPPMNGSENHIGSIFTVEIMLGDICLFVKRSFNSSNNDPRFFLDTLKQMWKITKNVDTEFKKNMFNATDVDDTMFKKSYVFVSMNLSGVLSALQSIIQDRVCAESLSTYMEKIESCISRYLENRHICGLNLTTFGTYDHEKYHRELNFRLHIYEEQFGAYSMQQKNRRVENGRFDFVLVCHNDDNIPLGTLFFQIADHVGSKRWNETIIMSRMEMFLMCPVQRHLHDIDPIKYPSNTSAMLTYLHKDHDWINRPVLVEPLHAIDGNEAWVKTLLRIGLPFLLVESFCDLAKYKDKIDTCFETQLLKRQRLRK